MTASNEITPSDIPPPREVALRKQIDEEHAALLASGAFTPLFEAWLRHSRLWAADPDGLSFHLMRQGLAGAALQLSARPRDESVAWTVNLKAPPTNVFVTGEARQGTVTGRVFTENVRTAESSRIYVQTIRPEHEPILSAVEVGGVDVLEIFEQYYDRSEQNPARFFELPEDRFIMVLGLPGVDREWLRSLDRDKASRLNGNLRFLEERVFRFECGCSPERMLAALRAIFEKDPEDLFRGEERVETFCPRCGRRWWVTRAQFRGE